MAKEAHKKAAEHHESAAKSHRTAAEHHDKSDHATAREHSTKAHEASTNAHKASTDAHENVSDSGGIDQSRITSNFDDDIPVPTAPVWTSWTYQGPGLPAFVTGTKASPTRYAITGNLGTFVVAPPASGVKITIDRVAP